MWKLYKIDYETDGSTDWYVNGEVVPFISYHSLHHPYFFSDNDYSLQSSMYYDVSEQARLERSGQEAIKADFALSILADYFNEAPSEEQLNEGQCLCWKYHIDFKNELLNRYVNEFDSGTIALWLEKKNSEKSLEQEIIKMLASLPIAIAIKQESINYSWAISDYDGVRDTFIEALEDALKYLDVKKINKKFMIELAIKYYQDGNYEKAIEKCEKALSIDRNYARAYHGIARSLFKQEKYLQSLYAYNKLIDIEQNNSKIYVQRGNLHFIMNNYRFALDDYSRALALDPDNKEVIKKKNEVNKCLLDYQHTQDVNDNGEDEYTDFDEGPEFTEIDCDYEKEEWEEEYYGYMRDWEEYTRSYK